MSELGVVRALRPTGTVPAAHYGAANCGTAVANGAGINGTVANGSNAMVNGVVRQAAPAFGANGDLRRRVSDEELELLVLLADGLPVEAIARRLALSDRTVRRRSRAMCDRLGARAPIQVVAWAARQGLI